MLPERNYPVLKFCLGLFEAKGICGHTRSIAGHCSRVLADDLGVKMCHNCHVGQGEGAGKSEWLLHLLPWTWCITILLSGEVPSILNWPDTGTETFGQYQVVTHSCTEYAEYTLREFKLVDKKVSVCYMLRFFLCKEIVQHELWWYVFFCIP